MLLQDLTWQRFGRLTVIKHYGSMNNEVCRECICDCGNTTIVRRGMLKTNRTRSCWCLLKETRTKHWMCYTRFNRTYRWIWARCNNKNNRYYKNYWWRWIKLLWESFEQFRDDMYESYLEHVKEHGERQTTIDRKENDWHYCKENCKWSTWVEQANNKRFYVVRNQYSKPVL
jgi:hypothetical protein